MNASSVMVWFRQDLRLADNPALSAAAATGRPLVPVFVMEDEQENPWGGASRWWLHHSLAALGDDLARRGVRLVLRRGNPRQVLPALARECGAGAVFWNQRHDPSLAAMDQDVKAALKTEGGTVHEFLAGLLAHPEALATGQGKPYQVFTPYSKKFLQTQIIDPPLPAPDHLVEAEPRPSGLDLEALELLPQVSWDGGLRETWEPGESGARGQCALFGAREMGAVSGTPGPTRLPRHLPVVASSALGGNQPAPGLAPGPRCAWFGSFPASTGVARVCSPSAPPLSPHSCRTAAPAVCPLPLGWRS